jgi:epoxyqueuosine reductase
LKVTKDMAVADPWFAPLDEVGLNLQTVFNLADLPADVLDTLGMADDERDRYTQLILIGHRGRDCWAALQQRGMHGTHPLDQFATERVQDWMTRAWPTAQWRQVFPGPHPVGLQRLGALAGWHRPSPFWVGVDAEWGSWFAYRAVVLADTALPVTTRRNTNTPCDVCSDKPCISACPAGALASEQTGPWRLQTCLAFRQQPQSPCLDRCLARNACPVGEEYRYTDQQIAYHYLHSMRAIREHS